jgi:hypothetical protein
MIYHVSMDKKQSLTPELKQIYERVMNTPLPAQSPPASTVPTPAKVSSPVVPVSQPVSEPAHVVTPPSAVPQPSMAATHTVVASPGITVHPAAPSVGASSTKTFVFTGSAASSTPAHTPAAAHQTGVAKKGGFLNPKIMIFAGIAFFLIYAAVWLKVLNYF